MDNLEKGKQTDAFHEEKTKIQVFKKESLKK